jgi:glycosyltransferase involved in cell wall biosynthesis
LESLPEAARRPIVPAVRVGFDAKRAFHNGTGLGAYARTLLSALTALPDGPRCVLYTPTLGSRFPAASTIAEVQTGERWSRWGLGAWWRRFGVARRIESDGIDVFHGLSNELPSAPKRRSVPYLVTVHDCIAIRRPQEFSRWDRATYRWKLADACRRADLVLTPSAQTRDDVLELFSVPESRVRVLPQACDARFRKPLALDAVDKVRRKYHLVGPLLLSVGTIEPRKNALGIVEALARLGEAERPTLVLVGRPRHYARRVREAIERRKLAAHVRLLADVPDADMPALYAAARALVYPSFYEGFGIPVLEAMTVGTPVITAKGGCLEALGGDAAIVVDPADVDALAGAMRSVLGDDELAGRLSENGKRRSKAYDASELAARLLAIYREVLVR